MARLNQLQYRAAKLCTGALHFTNQNKLEEELGWETISKRAEFLGTSLFQKIHQNQTRHFIKECLPETNLARQNRNTNFYKKYPAQTSYFQKSFFPYFSKNFNNLDTNLKTENDLPTFKISLKSHLKPKKLGILHGD